MNTLALIGRQVRYENRAFWRNTTAAFFTFVFPLIFLVIFTLIFGGGEIEVEGGTLSVSTFYVGAIVAFSVINACYSGLATTVSFARDLGHLKRVRATPLPASVFLLGKVMQMVLMSLLLVVVVCAFGWLFYDVEVPSTTLPAALLSLIVGAASFSALALAATSFIRDAEAAPAVINATILPLLFISDVFIPLEQAPEWVSTVANVFPIRHFASTMHTAFNPFTEGAGFEWQALAVVAAWGLLGVLVAARFFRWEPRR